MDIYPERLISTLNKLILKGKRLLGGKMFQKGEYVKIARVNEFACPVFKYNDIMERLRGCTAKITKVEKNREGVVFYRIDLDSGRWKWEEGCLEKLPKEWD